MAAETAVRKAAEAEVAKMKKHTSNKKLKMIAKPRGSCGRDYKLREAMGLGNKELHDPKKKRIYSDCLVSCQRRTVHIIR